MRRIIYLILILFFINLSYATTLEGTIYDLELNILNNTLVEIDTTPKQQYLAQEGVYSFQLQEGYYTLKAKKGDLITSEKIKIAKEGSFIYDLFLLPSLEEEDEILKDTSNLVIEDTEKGFFTKYPWWSYVIALLIFLLSMIRIYLAKKKYGPLKKLKLFKKKQPEEPEYLSKTLKIIKKNNGRISQKELRKEMMDLSEAKISLILTELEHKNKIEKIKKGRGNVIILKE